jgi:hypothetical protein
MLELYAAGALGKSGSFPRKINSKSILKINLSSKPERVFYEEILSELKTVKGDSKVKDAIEHILSKSNTPSIRRKIISAIGVLDQKFNKNKLYFFLAKKGVISKL